MPDRTLRVLLVPDSIFWVTGTMAKWIAEYNPWISPTICSGNVLSRALRRWPNLARQFDLVHFICPYASKDLISVFREYSAIVTTIHHVVRWESEQHNLGGDAVMVVARQWHDDLLSRGVSERSVVLVRNGVDGEIFRPRPGRRSALRRKIGFEECDFVIGFIAKQLSDDQGRKGIDVFESALVRTISQLPNAAALIVGMGWKHFVTRLRRRGIKCVWIPFINSQIDFASIYNCMDVYWVTSRIEGGPVPLLEAMSSAVPCVSTPVGLATEVISDEENGFIVPMEDSDAFANRTIRLAQDRTLSERIGAAARQRALAEYAYGIVSKNILPLYTSAIRAFQQRSERNVDIDIESIASARQSEKREALSDDQLLHGLSSQQRRWFREQEKINWIIWMAHMRQHREMFAAISGFMPRVFLYPIVLPRVVMSLLPRNFAALVRSFRRANS